MADRIAFVQYPNVRQVRAHTISEDRRQLKLWEGLFLAWLGFVGVVVIGGLLIVFMIFAYHFVTGS